MCSHLSSGSLFQGSLFTILYSRMGLFGGGGNSRAYSNAGNTFIMICYVDKCHMRNITNAHFMLKLTSIISKAIQAVKFTKEAEG